MLWEPDDALCRRKYLAMSKNIPAPRVLGEYKNFDFNKYIDIHLEAHRYYNQAEPGALAESMKILHFKSGIRSKAGMEASIKAAKDFLISMLHSPHFQTT